ncbi:Penicillin-binding protein 4* [Bremerella volcania]|uniref:Penicillin-binding protein 4 n=1 Tax=Bremerella volcania TaxID=2527984 RepID=A0A518CFX7_9BACT|nr:serine hydrolase domain-containing protein [Bremerella volcania]QDU78121.1 Penicillin-binding protein 4* [Bremerella volcania]
MNAPCNRRRFLTRLGAALSVSGLGAWSAGRSEAAENVTSTGQSLPGLAAYDLLMEKFFQENEPLGASLAVAYRGRLVYAKGFGFADLARESHVQPTSLFRIASLTKPITAVAVMKLAEQGKLTLDQPIVPLLNLDFLPEDAQEWADPRLAEITVRQCLQHTGGFDKEVSGDPFAISRPVKVALGVDFPLSKEDLLRFALTRKLDFDPGQKSAYANIGYLMLGRLIEQQSDQAYDEYVQQQVLHPLGIRRMQLARTLKEDAAEGEVQYRDSKGRTGANVLGLESTQWVPYPYGIERIENLAPVGGWLASSIDLVRFTSGLFFPTGDPILSRASLKTMFAPPKIDGKKFSGNEAYYACGWLTRPSPDSHLPWTCWHTGSLTGVSTLLVSRADGVSWCVLFNQDRAPDGQAYASKIDGPLHAPANSASNWPEGDLFAQYL